MIDGGHERVEQARIVAASVEVTELVEKLLGVLPTQVVWPLDAEADQLVGDGRTDVG